MKAAYLTQTGPPDCIRYGDLPEPQEPTGARVVVRVRAVALNPIDTYIRSGLVKMDLPSPFIVGCDMAGVVESVGPDVTRFEPGDRVWGSNQGLLGRQGIFAERVCTDETWLYSTPPKVTDEQAAAIAMVGITAHLGLVRDAKLQQGETVLVNGASGGVGSTVVQMAKLLGARVIATVGGRDRIEPILNLGADHVIDYKTAEIESAVRQIAPGGVNVWWETAREPDFDRAVAALASRGRMILMAGREARPPSPSDHSTSEVAPSMASSCSALTRTNSATAPMTSTIGWRPDGSSRASTGSCPSPRPPPPIGSRRKTPSAKPAHWPAKSSSSRIEPRCSTPRPESRRMRARGLQNDEVSDEVCDEGSATTSTSIKHVQTPVPA